MKSETIERARTVDQAYFGNISIEKSVGVFAAQVAVMKKELTAVHVRRKVGDMLFAIVAIARNHGWDLDDLLREATEKVEGRMRDKHYYEAHVTIEPVFGKQLAILETVASKYGFRVADLLMQKRAEDTPERSKNDTFCTARSISYSDLETRMFNLAAQLTEAGFTVWRYKIESTLLDSRYSDAKFPLDRAKLPSKELQPRPPAQIPLSKGEQK